MKIKKTIEDIVSWIKKQCAQISEKIVDVIKKQDAVVFLLMVYDFIAIHFAYFFALWVRFDFIFSHIPIEYRDSYVGIITLYAVGCILVLRAFGLYNLVWRFVSYIELVKTFLASLLLSIIHSILITVLFTPMPMAYHFGGMLVQFVLLTVIRFSYKFIVFERARRKRFDNSYKRVMLIGAGSAGQLILRDVNTSSASEDRIVCIIDDNPNNWNRSIDGIPIVGGRDDILVNVDKYMIDKIFLAIPAATAEERRDILNICSETECELKQLPGIFQLTSGQISVNSMKDVSIEDLLGRNPIKVDLREVYEQINGKVILVTGGGGSIGSELCRQVAAHNPKQLIIFDIYENNAYEIQNELRERFPYLNLVVLIGSVRDSRRMFQVFEDYRPQIVYHAAAHKHVPLMEDSPCEAIKNNAIGTYKTAYAAMVHGCERFVLISTDKAVNPTNVMGASKRICEMIIQSFDRIIKDGKAEMIPQLFTHPDDRIAEKANSDIDYGNIQTEFVAVRFGNVLGSNGSVIPLFKKQIEKGGPVTVTHPDIIRYFMTIPEAVSLVMLAGTYAHGGELFVLDMGSPVKIDSLARNLIKLSGFKPDVDIKVVYTGLRPGEKLYEEKLMAEEGLETTANELIHIGHPIDFETDRFLEEMAEIMDAAYANSDSRVKELITVIVPTYKPVQ